MKIEANACNEPIYCQEDNLALMITFGVMMIAAIFLTMHCIREHYVRAKMKKIIEEHQINSHFVLNDDGALMNNS